MITLDKNLKECTKCGQTKPVDEFHIHTKSTGLRRGSCKECFRLSERIRDNARYRKRESQQRSESARIRARRRSKEKRVEVNATQAIYRSLKKGLITRGVCEICGETKVDGHHEDYSKPLEVRWLCRSHHKQIHSKLADEAA